MWPLLLMLLGGASHCRAQPFECAHGCTKIGNCNTDTGDCICPYGRVGKACEVDALSACRITPDSAANCGRLAVRSCECYRQCKRYHCHNGLCDLDRPGLEGIQPDRACFMREGLAPEQQHSKPPDEGEAGVRYYDGWAEGANEIKDKEQILKRVMRFEELETLPLERCPASCHNRGFCLLAYRDAEAKPFCACLRPGVGMACENEVQKCPLNCSARGKCLETYFCHCEPPYFGQGCARSKSYPATSRPSPVDIRIYMYELNTQWAYEFQPQEGAGYVDEGEGMYAAYFLFLEQFLTSPWLTEDPSEANLFYVPAFLWPYVGAAWGGQEHMTNLLTHVAAAYPWFNRSRGRDHFVWATPDLASCHFHGIAAQPRKITHFGYYFQHPKDSSLVESIREHGTEGYTCYHPLRDVNTPPHDTRYKEWAQQSQSMTIDDILAQKTKLLFFTGAVIDDNKESLAHSGGSRQALDPYIQEWKEKDSDIQFIVTNRGETMGLPVEEGYRRSKFCLATHGWGFGVRLMQAMLLNCVPVIVEEHVFQPFQDIIPYETFSICLNNADMPNLRRILQAITAAQYRGMLEQLVRNRGAFHWDGDGSRAFEFTVASLRRKHLNMKALYF